MKIQRIHIKNFKSIVDLEIIEPNPFTVFVGPNGSGKSNIFEALEFWSYFTKVNTWDFSSLFGGAEYIINRTKEVNECEFETSIERYAESKARIILGDSKNNTSGSFFHGLYTERIPDRETALDKLFSSFSRIFVKNKELQKINYSDNTRLNLSTDNLEKVLKRILQDDEKKQEIREWLDLFIPGFERVEIVSSELSSTDTLVMYEKGVQKPFTKDLLSDGTYNILALLTAVYQSDQPQFLCIEEPENGLNPYVIRKLVDFFRDACEEKGHYIWLNTHSGTLVDCLTPEEVILVDKAGGQTQIKQLKGLNLHGLDMAEAWLSGALGGGTLW